MDDPVTLYWFSIWQQLPWRWDERGEAIVDPSGATIVLFDELLVLAQALAPGGLPPISALALLCAACRDQWHEQAPGIFADFDRALEKKGEREALLARLRPKLDLVAALPRERRATTSAKLALAIIMRDRAATPPPDPSDPDSYARHYRLGTGVNVVVDVATLRHVARVGLAAHVRMHNEPMIVQFEARELLDYLDRGLIPPTAATQELVERTGLEALPEPAPLSAGAVRALLAGLTDDDELGGLAALAVRLLAAVHLPRPLAASDELAVDGFSDLSNRGSPDRLLLSELANDGLVLAARVAMGEALYLRREAPPQSPPQARVILIDTGIRLWGVARVFATAVALALAASGQRGARSRAWRTVAPSAVDAARTARTDLGTRAGLVDQLATLSPEPQPGAALTGWRAAWDGDGDEAVLITHAAAFADPALRAALAALPPLHVATVDAHGRYRLYALAGGGSALVQEAELDLALLSAPVDRERTVALRPPLTDPPAIYGQHPFPLLLPHRPDAERLQPDADGSVLSLTHDGRMMLWPHGARAAVQLADRLPDGVPVWLGWSADTSVAHALLRRRRNQGLVLAGVRPESGRAECVRLREGRFVAVRHVAQEGALLAIGARGATAYRLDSGSLLDELAWPAGAELREGRFLVSAAGWHALAWDGERLALVEVCKADAQDPRSHFALAFFDRPGVPGPWRMTGSGRFTSLADGDEFAIDAPRTGYGLVGVSLDGARAVVVDGGHCSVVDFAKRRAARLREDPASERADAGDAPAAPVLQRRALRALQWPVMERLGGYASPLMPPLRGVFRCGDHLGAWTVDGRTWKLDVSAQVPHWKALPQKGAAPANGVVLATVPEVDGRWQLRRAAAGACTFTSDARGLLHCRCHRRGAHALAELTIGLFAGATVIWSDGRQAGPAGYLAASGGVLAAESARYLFTSYAQELP